MRLFFLSPSFSSSLLACRILKLVIYLFQNNMNESNWLTLSEKRIRFVKETNERKDSDSFFFCKRDLSSYYLFVLFP